MNNPASTTGHFKDDILKMYGNPGLASNLLQNARSLCNHWQKEESWFNVDLSPEPCTKQKTLPPMIRNYFKVALRSILRNKLSSFINISGLALAMCCSLMIFMYIADELSYDRYNTNADRIYRVTRDFLSPDGSVNLHLGHVSPPFGPLLKNDFTDFEQVVRTLPGRFLLAYQENGEEKKSFNEDNSFYAEPEIFKVFTIPVIEGNPDKALNDPFHMMLAERTA